MVYFFVAMCRDTRFEGPGCSVIGLLIVWHMSRDLICSDR